MRSSHYLIAVVLAVAITVPAQAGNRCTSGYCAPTYHANVVQQVAVPQTIIQNQNVFYSVGQDVRYGTTDAVVQAESQQIQREAQRLQDRLADFQKYQQQQPQTIILKLEAAAAASPQAAAAITGTAPTCHTEQQSAAQAPAKGIISDVCLKCHKGPDAKAGFRLDESLTCEQKLKAISKVVAGEMPPTGALSGEQSAQFLEEITQLKTAGEQQPADKPQAPPTDQPATDDKPEFSQLMQQLMKVASRR